MYYNTNSGHTNILDKGASQLTYKYTVLCLYIVISSTGNGKKRQQIIEIVRQIRYVTNQFYQR